MRIVDLFCGIGGVAEAIRPSDNPSDNEHPGAHVVAAFDIDRAANLVYTLNHGVPVFCKTLESIGSIPDSDLWWLSPPCQPYTRRGRQLGELDGRSQALGHLIELIDRDRPSYLMLENVPDFAGSAHHQRLTERLSSAGYSVQAETLCPTQWGVPMRRMRFYLRACRDGRKLTPLSPQATQRTLIECLDADAWTDKSLVVDPEICERYRGAMNVVSADDTTALLSCFTSAYGKSPVHAGSYLRSESLGVIRRFSVSEIARLMGFRENFEWPPELDQRARYRLLGNSLSVTVVRALLKSIR